MLSVVVDSYLCRIACEGVVVFETFGSCLRSPDNCLPGIECKHQMSDPFVVSYVVFVGAVLVLRVPHIVGGVSQD